MLLGMAIFSALIKAPACSAALLAVNNIGDRTFMAGCEPGGILTNEDQFVVVPKQWKDDGSDFCGKKMISE